MTKAAIIAALSIPVFTAAASDYAANHANSCKTAETWQQSFTQIEAELTALGVDLQAPATESAEIPETEDTVAVADKGLFFNLLQE